MSASVSLQESTPRIRFIRELIPAELAERRQWLAWKLVASGNPDRPFEKVPICPRTGWKGSHSDPATWGSLDEACAAVERLRLAGIGFVFTEDDPYTGIDYDGYVTDYEVAPDAMAAIERFGSYAEYSPSGTGIHIIVAGPPVPRGRKHTQKKIEVYSSRRFFTMTGSTIPGFETIRDVGDDLLTWYRETFGEAQQPAARPNVPRVTRSDADVIALLRTFHNGEKFSRLYDRGDTSEYGGDDSAADMALACLIAFATRDPAQIERIFSGSALAQRDKWQRRQDYRERTIHAALDLVTEWYEPTTPARLTVNGKAAERFQRQHTNGTHDPDSEPDRGEQLTLSDFLAYLPEHRYIFRATGKLWTAAGVNGALPPVPAGVGEDGKPKLISPSAWLDENAPVHDLTWVPGEPELIEGRFLDAGGWVEKPGGVMFNQYRPPRVLDGRADAAAPWLEHVFRVYPTDAEHILDWLAHRVQRPGEKINHALVLGGMPGIGKDTLLEPVRHAVGPWNFGDVSPAQLVGRFNPFLKAVILRVSELRDLGDVDRYGFYEHTKTIIAAPPESLLIDQKFVNAYLIPNVVGVVFTTNHRTDGLYLPPDDRRHYVAWSEATPDDFPDDYWAWLYRWFEDDGAGSSGFAHVAAYLRERDIARFDPKAPPPKTQAFWDIVAAGRAPEDAEMADALERLGWPDAVTIGMVIDAANGDLSPEQVELGANSDFALWLKDRKNARKLPHRFEAAGYVAVRNDDAQDGLWRIGGKRCAVYAKSSLAIRDRITAAQRLATG